MSDTTGNGNLGEVFSTEAMVTETPELEIEQRFREKFPTLKRILDEISEKVGGVNKLTVFRDGQEKITYTLFPVQGTNITLFFGSDLGPPDFSAAVGELSVRGKITEGITISGNTGLERPESSADESFIIDNLMSRINNLVSPLEKKEKEGSLNEDERLEHAKLIRIQKIIEECRALATGQSPPAPNPQAMPG